MTWLDRALATPTVGFLLKPEIYTEHDYLTALKPLLERWAEGGDLNITYPGVAQISIQTAAGFNYTATAERLVVQFGYQYDLKDQPGARPILHYRVEPEKYSVLLQRAIDESCDFVGSLVGSGSRKLTRVGIVATVRINSQSPPPGIEVFLRHLERPWSRELLKYEVNLVSVLSEAGEIREQCHHRIRLDQSDDDRKNDLRLMLDWQRVLLSPPELRANKVRDHLVSCSEAALSYFERFGRGELNYGPIG